jgi:hypothetical protein
MIAVRLLAFMAIARWCLFSVKHPSRTEGR